MIVGMAGGTKGVGNYLTDRPASSVALIINFLRRMPAGTPALLK